MKSSYLGPIFLLCVITFAAGFPMLNSYFRGDDILWVHDSMHDSNTSFEDALRQLLLYRNVGPSYRPVTNLIFFFYCIAFKMNPLGYHFANVFIHFLNGVMLYLIYLRIQKTSSFILILLTLLFLLNPVAFHAVAWISAIHVLYGTFLVLISIYLYERASPKLRPDSITLLYVIFFLGFFISEICFSIPILLLALELFIISGKRPIKAVWKDRWKVFVGFGILAVIFYIIRSYILSGYKTWEGYEEKLSIVERARAFIDLMVPLNEFLFDIKLILVLQILILTFFGLLLLARIIHIRKTKKKFIWAVGFFLIVFLPSTEYGSCGPGFQGARYFYLAALATVSLWFDFIKNGIMEVGWFKAKQRYFFNLILLSLVVMSFVLTFENNLYAARAAGEVTKKVQMKIIEASEHYPRMIIKDLPTSHNGAHMFGFYNQVGFLLTPPFVDEKVVNVRVVDETASNYSYEITRIDSEQYLGEEPVFAIWDDLKGDFRFKISESK